MNNPKNKVWQPDVRKSREIVYKDNYPQYIKVGDLIRKYGRTYQVLNINFNGRSYQFYTSCGSLVLCRYLGRIEQNKYGVERETVLLSDLHKGDIIDTYKGIVQVENIRSYGVRRDVMLSDTNVISSSYKYRVDRFYQPWFVTNPRTYLSE